MKLFDKNFVYKRIVFWDPSISPHKTEFLSELAKLMPGVELIYCAQKGIEEYRVSMGWSVAPSQLFNTMVSPTLEQIENLILTDAKKTFHVFSGIHWVPMILSAMKIVKRNNANFCIISEPRDSSGIKGKLRYFHSILTEGWCRKKSSFILAIGANGEKWFKAVGYPCEKIFPFAYFVNPPNLTPSDEKNKFLLRKKEILVGYVGRIIRSKGVFYLMDALRLMQSVASLHIVGEGADVMFLKKQSFVGKLDVHFTGVVPISEIGSVMRGLDVLVLPSIEKDGWGVVVSEALMSGTAVIATKYVGASLVLSNPHFGRIVEAASSEEIVEAVMSLKNSGEFSSTARRKRSLDASNLLSSFAGAKYFLDILKWAHHSGDRPNIFMQKS